MQDLLLPDQQQAKPFPELRQWADDLVSNTPSIQQFTCADGSHIDVFVHAIEQDEKTDKRLDLLCIDVKRLPKLRASAQDVILYFEALLRYTPEYCYFSDADGKLLTFPNHDVEDMLPELGGKTLQSVLPATASQQLLDYLPRLAQGENEVSFDYDSYKLGQMHRYTAKINKVSNLSEQSGYLTMLLQQPQSSNLAEQHYSDQIYRQMFESNRAVKLILDPDNGNIIDANQAAVDFYGYHVETLKAMNISQINTLSPEQLLKEMDNARQEKRLFFKFKHKLSNGDVRHVDVYSGPLLIADKTYLYSIVHDVSERQKAEQKILHQAHYDTLTGIPNRFLALDRLAQLMREAERAKEQLAVMFIDLDDFKKINDSLGHETGDKLLIEASQRFLSVMRGKDTVGRLGGDEFIVLAKGLQDANDATAIAQSLMKEIRKPFLIDGHELLMSASIGIALYPSDGQDASVLLRNSDIAMYRAKELGRNNYSFFTESMNKKVAYQLKLEGKMHGALNRNEFSIVYQPQIDVTNGLIIGAEALLRWNNKVLGNVSPADFIPVAEQSGMIIDIGEYVISNSIEFLSQVQGFSNTPFRMAVNISPRQLRNNSLLEFIIKTIKQNGIMPHSLELEITEGVLMVGSNYVNEVLNNLSESGIALSMDDFGTGYSSMSYLRKYPFDLLKIDKSFVSGISETKADKELVIATIAIAKALGLKVVAEGVETQEQYHVLQSLGCDYAQGYLFGKPMMPEELLDIVKSEKPLI